VKNSTATGTTATADPARPALYRGRFAPSPTGALHQGSLLAAVASWLDARSRDGTWLIRMEDVDRPREVPGAAADILATLARFGMESDEPVLYQSTRGAAYAAALRQLVDAGLAYRCRCSRSELQGGPYDGRCRDLGITDPDSAWRLRMDPDAVLAFEDRVQGHCEYTAAALGDPVLVRRDGLAAYQLAVVVDDAFQGITDIVRGADLLESTAWQIALGNALGLAIPSYAHIPVLTEPDGQKLSKSRRSVSISTMDPAEALRSALQVLIGTPQHGLNAAEGSDTLLAAVQHWDLQGVSGMHIRSLAK
jgi:glutamyl-Q tRNA(Asp) synthetase